MLTQKILGFEYLQGAGFLTAFFAAFLEGLPMLGLLIPGQTVVMFAGFLSQQGVFEFSAMLTLIMLGAVLGDCTGYWIGRRWGVPYLRGNTGAFHEVRSVIMAHPFKTLVLARFHPLSRSFAPFTAGASKLPLRKFLPGVLIGGTFWTLAWCGAGYVFGASYALIERALGTVLVATLTTLTIVILCYWYIRKKQLIQSRTRRLLATNITALIFFSMIAYSVVHNGSLITIDNLLEELFRKSHTSVGIAIAKTVTALGGTLIISLATALSAAYLVLKKRLRDAALLLACVVGAAILSLTFKAAIGRSRPDAALLFLDTMAFPSGHALMSTTFVLCALLLFATKSDFREWFAAIGAAIVFLICASRIYLSVHFMSDVFAGVFLGLFWVTFVFLVDEAYASYRTDNKKKLRSAQEH